MYQKYMWLFVLSLLVACGQKVVTQTPELNSQKIAEYPATEISLLGPLADQDAEISGLAWYGDTLILLPQYPDFNGDSYLYALPKADIEAYLTTADPEPLIPQSIPFVNSGIISLIDGSQGFEAIAFAGDRVYLTVEAELTEGMRGYLLAGQVMPDLREVVLEAVISEILPQTKHANRTDETLFIYADTLVTLYEVNGAKVNEAPIAHCFGSDLKAQEPLPFLNIEYRVTDATCVDSNGRFWVINFYDPRDKNLQTDSDALADRFGWGVSHSTFNQVERLVELQITNEGISFTDTPPVYLQLLSNVARKWEGLVRFNGGFLMATDKYPETILAYVGKLKISKDL